MELELESPLKTPTQEESIPPEFKTPPQNPQIDERSPEIIPVEFKTSPQYQQIDQNSRDSGNDLKKTCTPDRLKLPKAFKYPERYRSPTDAMMSPVTKGLVARNRKTGGAIPLPPSLNHPKIQEVSLFQN